MSHFQQPVYTTYPSPAVIVNSPQPVAYAYSQHPSMQSYYPSLQPQIAAQPVHYPPGQYLYNHRSDLTQLCMWILCLGACTYCCTEGCCGGDDCFNGTGYNDSCCC